MLNEHVGDSELVGEISQGRAVNKGRPGSLRVVVRLPIALQMADQPRNTHGRTSIRDAAKALAEEKRNRTTATAYESKHRGMDRSRIVLICWLNSTIVDILAKMRGNPGKVGWHRSSV